MLSNINTVNAIKEIILKHDDFLLITHQNPDGDGLGAIGAIGLYLKRLGKKYQLFCLDPVPANYHFLPLVHDVSSDANVFNQKYQVVIILDAGDLKYAGVDQLIPKLSNHVLINIDHHYTNTHYGQINLVEAIYSSASEIVYQLFRDWQVAIDKEIATALLNGIIFDTGAFSNAGTTLSCLKAASHLLNLGARHKEINDNYLRNKSLALLKLWGRAFERLRFNANYDLAYTVLTHQDLLDLKIEPETVQGLANFFNDLADAKISMVLYEVAPNEIKGSLRTTYDDLDVSKIAKQFGGGGHQKAAGFTISGKLVYNEGRWQIV